ncbi:hypothetical protein BCM20_005897, partial [Clostridium beijerinckii]|nr:hypothetical protein [Clostridium beijerinckii]
MNSYFKKFIIFVCVFGLLLSPLRPQRTDAIVGVDDC